MASLAKKLELAEKHLRTKDGQPFSLEGREWVREQYWSAIDGFKWWPVGDASALCGECKLLAGTLQPDWVHEEDRELVPGHVRLCTGLGLEPVRFTVLNLPRREGKTFNAAAYTIVTMAERMNTFMLYAAASEDQTEQLINENWVLPLERSSKALGSRFARVRNQLRCKRTKSQLEIVPTAFRSGAGRGKTHILFDEARDIPARFAMTLLPSLWAEHGWECPSGHIRYKGDRRAKTCNVCRDRLVPWFARAVIMSSAGVLEDTESDWFAQLVAQLEEKPDPNYHLFRMEEGSNPDLDHGGKDAFVRVFGQIESTRAYVEVEAGNRFVRKGDEFVPNAALDACTEDRTHNHIASDARCFGFLDTSVSKDLVSLVILSEDLERMTDGAAPWHFIRAEHVAVWDPKEFKGGRVDDRVIEAHIVELMPGFPGLISLDVDVRGSRVPWAEALVERLRRDHPLTWGRKVQRYIHGKKEQLVRDTGWSVLQEFILSERIRWPRIPVLLKELRGVTIQRRASGDYEVRDRDRRVRHADVAESFAGACYRIHEERSKRKISLDAASKPNERLTKLFKPTTTGMRGRGSSGF